MTKDYYKEVERTRIFFDNYKGFVRKIEHYPVYFYIGDGGIWFRFQYNLGYYYAGNLVLKDIENRLINDFPYIKSVQFYDEIGYNAGIIV